MSLSEEEIQRVLDDIIAKADAKGLKPDLMTNVDSAYRWRDAAETPNFTFAPIHENYSFHVPDVQVEFISIAAFLAQWRLLNVGARKGMLDRMGRGQLRIHEHSEIPEVRELVIES